MEMTPDKWEKVKVLFEAALERPTEQRIAYLTAACAEEDVRAQVIRLLANFQRVHIHEGSGGSET